MSTSFTVVLLSMLKDLRDPFRIAFAHLENQDL